MIQVYEPNETTFATNGIKVLHPLKAEVTKIDNGDYYAELKDDISMLEYYQKGMIIRIPTRWGVQGFRCDNPAVKNNKVECKAWHLSYDAQNYIIADSYASDKNCNDALAHFNSNTDITSPFTTISDISTIMSTRTVRKSLLEVVTWLASDEKYGGHLYRDNWNLGIKQSIGQDRGIVLAYAKNISDIQVSEDWTDVCTKILPYTTDGNSAVMLDSVYVSLDEELYDIPYTKIINFSNELNEEDFETHDAFIAATKEWLQAKAENYLQINKVPKVNYSVSALIDNVSDVGDTIYVKHPKCKVNIITNVISVVYDAIKGRYIKIEFGNFKKEVKNLIDTVTDSAVEKTETMVKETQTMFQSELETATAKINNVLGNSYCIYDGDKILIVDRLPKEQAVNVIRISNGGIGFSNSGINGTYSSAWTIDGQLDMSQINVVNLTASLIKGGVLKLGGANNSSGTFELYDNANRLIALMDKQGLTVYASNGDYVKLNADEGFAGYNKNGTKVYWADGQTFHMMNAEIENETRIAGKIKLIPVSTADNVGVGFVAINQE